MERRAFHAGGLALLMVGCVGQGREGRGGRTDRVFVKGCGRRLEGALLKVNGITKAQLEIATGILRVEHGSEVPRERIQGVVGRSSFRFIRFLDDGKKGDQGS